MASFKGHGHILEEGREFAVNVSQAVTTRWDVLLQRDAHLAHTGTCGRTHWFCVPQRVHADLPDTPLLPAMVVVIVCLVLWSSSSSSRAGRAGSGRAVQRRRGQLLRSLGVALAGLASLTATELCDRGHLGGLLATGARSRGVRVLGLAHVLAVLALGRRPALGLDHHQRLVGVVARGDPVPADTTLTCVLDASDEHHDVVLLLYLLYL